MYSSKRKTLKNSIIEFYKLHHDKGKWYTYKAWKKSDMSKSGIYDLLNKFDTQGNIDRNPGSGRPSKFGSGDNLKLKRLVNNKTGVSEVSKNWNKSS